MNPRATANTSPTSGRKQKNAAGKPNLPIRFLAVSMSAVDIRQYFSSHSSVPRRPRNKVVALPSEFDDDAANDSND